MGSNTPNQSFYVPANGETGWGNEVGSNFEDLDDILNGFSADGEELGLDRMFLGRLASTPADADIPTDTTVLYYKTGEPSTLYQKPDGGSETAVGGGGSSSSVGNVKYASEYSGADLAERIDAALNDIDSTWDGQGTVIVDAKPDGTAWQWPTSGWTVDPMSYGTAANRTRGIEVQIGKTVKIEWDGGTNPAITFDYSAQAYQDGASTFYGGNWEATNSDPEGFMLLRDAIHLTVGADHVDCRNTSGSGALDTYGFRLENDAIFCESNNIFIDGSGYFDHVVDFVPQAVLGTGNGGTNSFHDNKIEVQANYYGDWAYRLRGNCKGVEFEHNVLFGHKDNSYAWYFTSGDPGTNDPGDRWFRGVNIWGGKLEGPGANKAVIGYDDNYTDFYGPMIWNFSRGGYELVRDIGDGDGSMEVATVRGGAGDELLLLGAADEEALSVHQDSVKVMDGKHLSLGDGVARITESGDNVRLIGLDVDTGSVGATVEVGSAGSSSLNGDNRVELRDTPNGAASWAWSVEGNYGHIPLRVNAPSNPAAGDYYFDDGSNTTSGDAAMRIYDGTAWIDQA